MIRIIISKDFSDTPGGRYIDEGEFWRKVHERNSTT